jgi:F-type H+-transporting ATPase subunit delta
MRTDRALAKPTIETYASVLLDAAEAEGTVFDVGAQLNQAAAVVRGHAELRDTLVDDSVPGAVRRDIVSDVLSGLNPALVATIGLMAERGNIDVLSSVAETYGDLAEKRLNVVVVDVTTVVDLNDALREAIKNKLAAEFDCGIVLREQVDPAIIGGIIMSAHGRRVDASIVSQLDRTRVQLSTAHTGGEA